MELIARVHRVLPMQSGYSARGEWKKQSIIVEYGDDPRYLHYLELHNMRNPEDFARLKVGDEYRFEFNADSREYNGRFYTECTCYVWSARFGEQQTPQPQVQQPAPPVQQPVPAQPVPQQPHQQQPANQPQGYNVPQQGYQQPYQQQQQPQQGYQIPQGGYQPQQEEPMPF